MRKRLLISLLLATVLMVSIPAAVFATNSNAAPVLGIESKNLSLKDNVQPVFDVYYENVEAANVKLLVWTAPQTAYIAGTESVALTPYTVDADTLRFYYTDLTAKQMTDDLYVRVYAEKGGEAHYSDLVKFSVLEYAYTKLGYIGNDATTDTDLQLLLGEMLEYGTAAQKYFDYKADRPATADFLYVTVNGTTLPDGTNAGFYLKDDTIALSAPAQDPDGKPFSAWMANGAKVGSTAALTYTVTGNENITLTPVYGSLVSVSVKNGATADGETSIDALVGSQLTLKAAKGPNGFVFKHWKDASGTVVGTERTSTVTVTGETTYKAYYELGFGDVVGTRVYNDITMWEQGGIHGKLTSWNPTTDTGRVSFKTPILIPAGSTFQIVMPPEFSDPEDCPFAKDTNDSTNPCSGGCAFSACPMILTAKTPEETDIISGYTVQALDWKNHSFSYTAIEDTLMMITVKSANHAATNPITVANHADTILGFVITLIDDETDIAAGTYWQAELTDGIAKIEANRETLGTEGLSEFFYLADSHWPDNAGYSPALVTYIAEKVGTHNVIFGGDIIRRYNAVKQNAIDHEINAFYNAFENYAEVGEQLKIFTTLGNHDRNGSSNCPDVALRLTEQEAYDLYMKRVEKFGTTVPGDPSKSYYDDTANKVRYVQFYFAGSQHGMIEDGYVDSSLAWASERIKELDADWTVVLITHGIFCSSEGNANEYTDKDYEVVKKILALQGEADAEIAIWINGHVHEDRNVIAKDSAGNKIRIVSLNCDAFGNSNSATSYKMAPGSIMEQSFSFIQVDTKSQMIYLTRFGAGGDLIYGYGDNIGTSTSLDIDSKNFDTTTVRVHNGTTDGKSYATVELDTEITLTAIEISGHTFSHWVDKTGTTVATTATAKVFVSEANTYRAMYTANEGYKNVANDWINGSYNGSMSDWAGESHTVTKPTRLTSNVFTVKAGETITVTCPANVTMTNGSSSALMVAYTTLTPVAGSNTGDFYTDYTTAGKANWKKSYTNNTDKDVLIVFMLKPNDGNGGLNMSNPVLQEVSIAITK
ncbi:MAG: metallophosphoesterase [Clostridia bacterium]|nr:metallophosphoesterase [Clostridia bacterium]